MTNYAAVIKPRGYPYKFDSLKQFEDFSTYYLQQLSAWQYSYIEVVIQGSALRNPEAKDVDNAIVVSEATFDKILVDKFKSIQNKATREKYDLSKMSHQELMVLAEFIQTNLSSFSNLSQSFARRMVERKISSKSTKPEIIPDIRKVRKNLNEKFEKSGENFINDIIIITESSSFYIEPKLRLK